MSERFFDAQGHMLVWVVRHTLQGEVTRPVMGDCQYCGRVIAAKAREVP